MYHYVTKSREDFEEKVLRGGGAGITRKHTYFDEVCRMIIMHLGLRCELVYKMHL